MKLKQINYSRCSNDVYSLMNITIKINVLDIVNDYLNY